MNRPMLASWFAVGLLVAPSLAFGQQSAFPRPPRTFPEFAGTWVPENPRPQQPSPPCCLTAPASTPVKGFDPAAPAEVPPEPQLIITTSPAQITLATVPRAPHGTDVFRFDGTPTNVGDGQGTLTLVAGSLLLTVKSARMQGNYESMLTTTDLMSVSGDVLTIERQYTRSVRPLDGDNVGYIMLPGNEERPADTRVKMVYRRQAPPAQ